MSAKYDNDMKKLIAKFEKDILAKERARFATAVRQLTKEVKESRKLEAQEPPGSPEACSHSSYADGIESALALMRQSKK